MAFSVSRPGREVAVRETCTRGSLRPHLSRAWAQVVTPKGCSGASSAGLGGLKHGQVRLPGHQVVDLRQVDPAAVPVHRLGQLHGAVGRRGSPDFVGDDDLLAAGAQRAGEQLLGFAVHR